MACVHQCTGYPLCACGDAGRWNARLQAAPVERAALDRIADALERIAGALAPQSAVQPVIPHSTGAPSS